MSEGSTNSISLDDPSLYINRELSWLEFNGRVLEEAQDASVPLLERLKFLAIFESNLDEFFMVRVGGLQQKVQLGIAYGSGADRMPVKEILERITDKATRMGERAHGLLRNEIQPALEREGIAFRDLKDLTESDRKYLGEIFRKQIFPVLTPLAIDPGHPFPHLLNKSLNLAVILKRPGDPDELYAVVQVPSVLPRFVALPQESSASSPPKYVFTALETVIRLHMQELFPGMELQHDAVFRVTRNSDFEIEDEEVEDLLKTIEEEVRKRRRGAAVRLQVESAITPELELFLTTSLDLDPSDVYRAAGFLDLTGLFQIHGLPGFPQLRDPQFTPQPVPEFANTTTPWAAIRSRDILVHHPYESFGCVVDFIEAAASDDRVL
ncbi:MAG: RNA degradosome polyphosphate kinase, partial [Gemmataceae bacterium]